MRKHFQSIVFFIIIFCVCFCFLGATIYSRNKTEMIISCEGKTVLEKEYKIKLSTEIKVLIRYKNDFYKFYQDNKDKKEVKDFSCINEDIKTDIEKTIKSIEYPYHNAKMNWDREKAEFKYIEGKSGKRVSKTRIIENFYKNFGEQTRLPFETKEQKCKITVENLKKRSEEIGMFSTSFQSSSANRKHNVKLATEKLNGARIKPDGILSFNEIVGARSQENGFRTSKIISNGEFIDGIGGGVCQVSTTLYNAWIRANLEAINAKNHSLPVSYVPPSFDAMVTSANDLSLINSSKYDVFVKAYTENDNIFIKIYGMQKNVKVVLRNNIIKEIGCNEYQEVDWKIDWKENEKFRIVRQPRSGMVSELYRDVYEGEKLIATQKLRENYYGVQKGLIVKRKIENKI